MGQEETNIDVNEEEQPEQFLDIISEYEDLMQVYAVTMKKTADALEDIAAKKKDLEEKGLFDDKAYDDLQQRHADIIKELNDTETKLLSEVIQRKEKELDETLAEKNMWETKYHIAKRINEKIKYGHKLYPNDPCPCGSGKKYKNCCGKGKG